MAGFCITRKSEKMRGLGSEVHPNGDCGTTPENQGGSENK